MNDNILPGTVKLLIKVKIELTKKATLQPQSVSHFEMITFHT